jgi:hypothetical protein
VVLHRSFSLPSRIPTHGGAVEIAPMKRRLVMAPLRRFGPSRFRCEASARSCKKVKVFRRACPLNVTTGFSHRHQNRHRAPHTARQLDGGPQPRIAMRRKERATGVEPATSSLGSFLGLRGVRVCRRR